MGPITLVAEPVATPAEEVRPPARIGGLDGLRAVAVLPVVVFHLAPNTLPGGFLGVDVFMVLSGYLITGLLLREHGRAGRVRLRAFWGRRFRRLVPAVLFLLAVVATWVHLAGPRTLVSAVRSQGFAALVYASNWRLVADGVSYGGAFGGKSPLLHLWSLAVEEQFYLVWPLALVALLALGRGRRGPAIVVTAIGAIVSASLMAHWYVPGRDPMRLYYGTDTRAQAFLIGALAAFAAPRLAVRGRKVIAWAGTVAMVAVLGLMTLDTPDFLYRGGFALVAVLTALAVLSASGAGPLTAAVDRRVLRGIGRVSYGIYLWHWPAIVLLTPERVGIHGWALLGARLGVTAAGTLFSWFLIERPFHSWRPRLVVQWGAVAAAASAASLALLPAAPAIAYSSVRVDHVPAAVVTAHPTPAATTPPATGGVAPVAPGTVMFVGDSGMFDETPALSAGFANAGWRVVSTSFPGIGLTRDGMLDQLGKAAEQYRPDLVVVMLGGWDIEWAASHGATAYRSLLDDAVRRFTEPAGGRVLWLSMLPGGTTADRPVDRYYAELPARQPGKVDYFDIEAALRSPDGGWPRVVDGKLLRKPDEWHLCPDGAAAVAHRVLAHEGIDRPGWDAGAWRNDPRYDDPKGGCAAP